MRSRYKQRILRKFLISYLALLAFATLTGIAAYTFAFRSAKTSVRDANLAALEHARDLVDGSLADIRDLVATLVLDSTLNRFLTVAAPLEQPNYSLMRKTWQSLPRYQITNPLVYDYFVHFKESGVIMSPDTLSFRLKLYYEDTLRHGDLGYDEWYAEYLGKPHTGDILPPQQMTIAGKTERLFAYLQSIPLGYPDHFMGTVVVLLREDGLLELLTRLNLPEGGWAYILDENGRLMASASQVEPELGDAVAGRRGQLQKRTENGRMHIAYTTSTHSGWRYVAGVPHSFLVAKVAGVRRFAVAAFIISTMIGVLVAYTLAFRTSKPFQQILQSLRARSADAIPENADLTYLSGTVSSLIDSNSKLRDVLDEQRPMIQTAFFDRLLMGDISGKQELDSYIKQTDINLAGNSFVSILLVIRGYEDLLTDQILGELHVLRVLAMDEILDIVADWAYVREVDYNKFALVATHEVSDPSAAVEAVERMCRSISRTLRAKYRVSTLFFAGDYVATPLEIHRSYAQAKYTLGRRPDGDGGDVNWFANLSKKNSNYYYPIDIEWALMRSIRTANLLRSVEILDDLRRENLDKRGLTQDSRMFLHYQIRGTFARLSDDALFAGNSAEYHSLLEPSSDSEEFFSSASDVVRDMCIHFDEQLKTKRSDLIRRILDYIDSVYIDPQLGLAQTASQFGLSEVYVSQLFKKEVGENFSSYLTSVRLMQAQDLLARTNLPIDKVSAKVGYSSPDTFRKAFRRTLGATPSSFRYASRVNVSGIPDS